MQLSNGNDPNQEENMIGDQNSSSDPSRKVGIDPETGGTKINRDPETGGTSISEGVDPETGGTKNSEGVDPETGGTS